MNDQDEFIRKMENLNVPEITPSEHPAKVKMAIMNAERSATLGLWLVIVPCYFLLCVFMKYYFHKNLGMLDNINEIMTGMSHHNIYLRVVWAIILVGLPVTTIVLNMLAILHVQHNKPANEIVISLRLRMFNILLTLLSGIVIMVFLAYAIALSYQTK